jgi:hypothetical protein
MCTLQVIVDYALTDHVFGKAKLVNVESVNIWLGAHVMLEYPLHEAKELLVCRTASQQQKLDV